MSSPSPHTRPPSAHTQTYDADTEEDANTPSNERTSLLSKTTSNDTSTTRLLLAESLLQLRTATPIILAYTLQNSLQTVSVLIVGRLSPEALATAAFAYMFAMATGWLIALGGTTAIDTLASASFTGSQNPHDLGVILQRAFFVLGLFYVPVVIVWAASEPLFVALGQEPWLAHDAARFLWVLAPGGLGYIYFEALKKYLQAQEIPRPGTYVLLLVAPINAGLNYALIYPAGLGLYGAPLATGISYWLAFLLLMAFASSADARGRKSWGGFSKRALQPRYLLTFARLAVLGVIHIGTEWWAFEIVALVAGNLGTIPLAAQSVIMTTDQVLNTIPFGLGVAASSRVGNLLGASRPSHARLASHTAAVLSILLGAVVLAVLMGVKDVYARIFNDDESVVRLTSEVMPYVALFQIADGLNGSCGGVLRGMGRQHVGAAVNVVSYYVLALPGGIWLAWHGWGLAGLWVGQCVALYLVGLLEWAIVAWSNWRGECEKALGRLEVEERRRSVISAGDEEEGRPAPLRRGSLMEQERERRRSIREGREESG